MKIFDSILIKQVIFTLIIILVFVECINNNKEGKRNLVGSYSDTNDLIIRNEEKQKDQTYNLEYSQDSVSFIKFLNKVFIPIIIDNDTSKFKLILSDTLFVEGYEDNDPRFIFVHKDAICALQRIMNDTIFTGTNRTHLQIFLDFEKTIKDVDIYTLRSIISYSYSKEYGTASFGIHDFVFFNNNKKDWKLEIIYLDTKRKSKKNFKCDVSK